MSERYRDVEWVFGYGSLIWRPDFPHSHVVEGWIEGWTRRFWQGSTDHRGVPGSPGRVATLLEHEGEKTFGKVFQIAPDAREEVLEQLDRREQGGYERHIVSVWSETHDAIDALMYVATPDNPRWAGPASASDIALQIMKSEGPSGPNDEYLYMLAHALRQMGVEDLHVFEIEEEMLRYSSKSSLGRESGPQASS